MRRALLLIFLSLAGCKEFCERHLIADDPYQFETVPTPLLEREAYILEVRIKNRVAEPEERHYYALIKKELNQRGAM